MISLSDNYTLRNGVPIPCVGFGTWQTPDGAVAIKAIRSALECGYRHIDTAAVYGNEKSVGEALADSGIARKELFVTSKLWNTERGYEKTLAAFEQTLDDLQLTYLDLYLIHWPAAKGSQEEWARINLDTWHAFEKLYVDGLIRAIGVSNFLPHHLSALIEQAEIVPLVDQIEYHPGYTQKETVQFCKDHDILVEAWSPLGTGKMLSNSTLLQIAATYEKSVAQLCIRWCLQNGTLPLPKSVTPSRIAENADVFDFTITAEDMATIDALPFFGGSGLNPDTINF